MLASGSQFGQMPVLAFARSRKSGGRSRRRPASAQAISGAPLVSAAASAPLLPHLSALDGLRALAVLAVMAYHAGFAGMPGGFLGVEVFFVISGFLITSLLLGEHAAHGRIDLRRFWLRRARRLLPALFLVIATVLAVGVLFLPNEVARLRAEGLAAAGYVLNWREIVAEVSYFETIGRPSLLRHLWSLSVEEQFYVVWPLLFVLLLRWGRRAALALTLGGALASTLLMVALFNPELDPTRVYYGTDTRCAGFLIGAALAYLLRGRLTAEPGRPAPLADTAWMAGVAVLAVICWRWTDSTWVLFHGGFAVVALITAGVIGAAVHPGARLARLLLGRGVLRWLGTRSYAVYLWHWPVFMLTRPHIDVPFDGLALAALRLAATVVLAELSYRLVEQPVRHGALERAWASLQSAEGMRRYQLGARWAGGSMAVGALVVSVACAQGPTLPDYLAVESVNTIDFPDSVVAQPLSARDAGAGVIPQFVSAVTAAAPATATATPAATPRTRALATAPAETAAAAASAAVATDSPEPAVATEPAPTPEAASEASSPADAAPEPPPLPQVRVVAIGDSVLLGAAAQLRAIFGPVGVDAAVGRQAGAVLSIVRSRRGSPALSDVVVLHFGNNGVIRPEQFDQIMTALEDTRLVVVLNVHVPQPWAEGNNGLLADAVGRYPNAVLIDWDAVADAHPEGLYADGIHLRPEGATMYVDQIAAVVERAYR